MIDYSTINEIRESIERAGALEKVSKDLTNRCYEKLKKIEEIASTEGRGTKLGKANQDYTYFLNAITPILSVEQLTTLDQRYDEVKKVFSKLKMDGRVCVKV